MWRDVIGIVTSFAGEVLHLQENLSQISYKETVVSLWFTAAKLIKEIFKDFLQGDSFHRFPTYNLILFIGTFLTSPTLTTTQLCTIACKAARNRKHEQRWWALLWTVADVCVVWRIGAHCGCVCGAMMCYPLRIYIFEVK